MDTYKEVVVFDESALVNRVPRIVNTDSPFLAVKQAYFNRILSESRNARTTL